MTTSSRTEKPSSQENLFEQLGGEAAVNAAVDIFYKKVLSDSLLAPFFANIEMSRQIKKQKSFLTMAFGGPHKYSGRSMRAAHSDMVKNHGLNDAHFDAVASHLKSALEELKVSSHLIDQVLAIAESTRADVLNR